MDGNNNSRKTGNTQTDALLLTSLDNFKSIIFPLLDSLKPKSVCEIGIGNGDFCRRLIDYCASTGTRYTGIDPSLSDDFVRTHQTALASFTRRRSLEALSGMEPHPVYFVDGDHNYYTVSNELRLITTCVTGRDPLVILHDVGWPWGRRDQYCEPEAIPAEFRQDYALEGGVTPGSPDLQADGFKGTESDYQYAAATHEGGAGNGVLTAVEDFIESSGNAEWKLIGIPVIFGMGILYHPEGMVPEVIRLLDGLASALCPLNDILKIMEANRLDLFLKFNKNLKHIKDLSGEYQALLAQYKKLAKHAADLLKAWHGLKAYADSLEAEIERLRNAQNH